MSLRLMVAAVAVGCALVACSARPSLAEQEPTSHIEAGPAPGTSGAPPMAIPGRPTRPLPTDDALRSRADSGAGGPGSFSAVATLTVALLAVAGAASWITRRGLMGTHGKTGSDAIQVVGRAAVGPRQAVVIVRAGSRRLLLGVGGQGAPTLLAELPDDEAGRPAS